MRDSDEYVREIHEGCENPLIKWASDRNNDQNIADAMGCAYLFFNSPKDVRVVRERKAVGKGLKSLLPNRLQIVMGNSW